MELTTTNSVSAPIEENINVFCRLKPIQYDKPCIERVHTDGTCKYNKYDDNTDDKCQETLFPIKCFEKSTQQKDIFINVAQPICDSVIKGYNGTIMAYGPTNSGMSVRLTIY